MPAPISGPAAQPPARTFAEHVADYALAGWPCVLPVPSTAKHPPPTGFTGAEGRDTDPMQLVAWAETHATSSIALRMPDGVIGIDVDQYVKTKNGVSTQKRGAETLAACVERWGPLPATWTSTAREPDGPSRVHFFRVPARRYATKLTGPVSGDVEVIQRHHRYAVVGPSPHEEIGGVYRWYDPSGRPAESPPRPDELAELPPAWVAGLAEGATEVGPGSADAAAGHALLDQLLDDWRPECAEVTNLRLTAADTVTRAEAGSRHDTMTARVHALVLAAAAGHTGAAHAVLELRETWTALTAGEDRAEELERMLLTSARKAVTVVGTRQVDRDPCMFELSVLASGPAPSLEGETGQGELGEAGAPGEPIAPPRWFSVREFIGAQAFDPNAGLDQSLAERVLERTWPMLRHAYDSGAWLLRAPETWEAHGNLTPWAVAQVAPLMPVGDPTAEKGSEPHERSKRRARLMSTPGANAVAAKMSALVAGGMHPAALRLTDLDADPEILWAGGRAWSLRSCAEGPVEALLDPSTPHLHAAAVAPEPRPTPLWDAFLEAVWPDPAIRAWAVRVIAIAVTGYADRALPILLGETGRGKTQVVALLMSVLGSYAHAANPKLLSPLVNEHDTIVFALRGRRLSFIDEAPSEAKAGQERLKQLTGGGELTARQMNQDPITFSPTHTFVLTANDEPVLTDPAVRSRTRLIPCEGDPEAVRVTRGAIGHVTGPAWRAEAPGVLAGLMREAALWLSDPDSAQVFAAPESIRYLAEHLGSEQDPVAVWVAEETEPYDEGTPARELYQAFVASCRRNSMRPDAIPSEQKWGRALTRMGIPVTRTKVGKRRPIRVRQGGFVNDPNPPADPSTQSVTPIGHPSAAEFLSADEQKASGDRYDGPGARLVTDSQANGHQQNPRSTPANPSTGDQVTDVQSPYAYEEQAKNRNIPAVGEALQSCTSSVSETPSSESADQPLEGLEAAYDEAPAEKPAKPKRQRSEAATAKARERSAEKRAAAIADAAGAHVALPAMLTRDGAVRTVELEQVDALLSTITSTATPLTVDVEHTGYPVGHESFALRTVQLGGEHFAFDLDPSRAEHAELIARHLAAAAGLHAHSATADLVPLADAGLADAGSAWAKMLDTGLLAKLSDPASTGNDADLKSLAKKVLDVRAGGPGALSPAADEARSVLFKAGRWLTDTEVTTPLERSGWAQVDPEAETMVRYAAADVLDDAALGRLLPWPAPAVLARELTVQQMTARVSHRGIRLDGEHVAAKLDEHRTAREEHGAQVRGFGVDNPGSNPQIAEALAGLGAQLPRTPAGKLSVAKGVIEPLSAHDGPAGDLARAVLAYRHHNTALTLLLEPYHELVTRGDGRARPTVYTLGADTGRMSCSRPNLQQVSREGGMRACFTADPGHLLISADFSGVELRVAAALSGDANLAAIMADPERDLHWEVARLAFGPEATKAQRYAIKRGVFGRIYGGGVGAVAAGVGVSEAVAHQVIGAMDSVTPQLAAWSRSISDAIASGRTRFQAYSGRVIHLPEGSPHAGGNYCIQGTARELLVDALLRWRETRWGEATLFPVHDELVVVVPEDEAADATAALVEAMTTTLPGAAFAVPIIAEASEPAFAWQDSA